MALPNEPYTRREVYLSNIAGQNTALPAEPYTREEEYLDYIAKNGGGGGTGEGDMKKSVYDSDLAVSSAGGIKAYVTGAIADKVDKVDGKGLSTNDYDDSAKAIVDGVTTALDGKVSKSNTAGLLKNDGSVDTTTTSAVSANTTAISNIKDGTSIDSFSDVETALSGKENTISDLSTIRSGASAGATAYQKPNDGIPKTDLASAVQTSLSKADSAVQDISGKADKVASATNGNFAGLDSNGNLTDSGKKSSDFATAASVTAIEGKIPSGASSSNKMATASDVTGLQNNVIANTKLIKDTVGWSGKNVLNNKAVSQTIDGITFTVNSDKSVKANTSSASTKDWYYVITDSFVLKAGSYVLSSGSVSNSIFMQITDPAGSTDIVNTANVSEKAFTLATDTTVVARIRYRNNVTLNNVVLYPMIRSADILDDTYEPYFGSTAFPRSEQAVLGAKNICCVTGIADKSSNTDVTWSANSVRVKSDVAAQYINTNLNIKSLPKNKTVKISFDATITTGDGIAIVKGKSSGSSYATLLNQPVGSTSSYEFEFNTGSNDDFQLNLYVSKGTASVGDITYDNIMISFDGGEFAPYAMTNKELTEIKNVELTPQTGVTLSADTRLSVTGNMASLSFQATADITASANNRLFNFSTNYKPKATTYGIAIINSTTVARIYIDTYGIAWLWGTSALTGATIQGSLTWIING